MENSSGSTSQKQIQEEEDVEVVEVSEQLTQDPSEETGNISNGTDKGKYVLIVEDDDFLRGLLSHSLNEVGYEVGSAQNAEMALEAIDKQIPSIILLDLMLPGMNGLDFLSEAKETRKLNMPVIILSNLGSKEDIDRALSLGAVDFIVKASVTPKQIIAKVQEILGA